MKALITLLLTLTLTYSSLARSYQVARIHGRITKISGDRVKVQDEKNQIFWVDRNKAYPKGSQIGDDVVIYHKVRFKDTFNNHTTSFFIKHRKFEMIKAARQFMLNYEQEMGFKYVSKKKKTVFNMIKGFFSIEEAHASLPSPDCYVGGRLSKRSGSNCEIPEGYECGEDNKGFRCSPAIFYGKEVDTQNSFLKSILYSESSSDKGFCIKHSGDNINRRCFNAALKVYGSEDNADDTERQKQLLEELYENLEDGGDAQKELEAMINDIDQLCDETEEDIQSCDDFVEELEEISNELLGQVEAKKVQKEADELEIRAQEREKITKDIEEFIKKYNGGQSPQIPSYQVIPQGVNPNAQAQYIIMPGMGAQQQGYSPIMPQIGYGMPRQPVIIMVVPQANQGSNNQQWIADLKKYLQTYQQQTQNDKDKDKQDDKDDDGDKDKEQSVPQININTYAYANKLENCKEFRNEIGDDRSVPDICLVKKDDGSYESYKYKDGEFQSFEAAKYDSETDSIIHGDQSFFIEELTNTDPDLDWECDVYAGKNVENDGSSCLASEAICKLYDEEGNLITERIGYLSSTHSQAFNDKGGKLLYSFDSQSKKASVSPALPKTKSNDESLAHIQIGDDTIQKEGDADYDFSTSRHPPLFYSPCQEFGTDEENTQRLVKADNKSCIKQPNSTYLPYPCEHGECKEEEIKICKTDVSCQVEYKNAFNKMISANGVELTLDCACDLEDGVAVDMTACTESQIDKGTFGRSTKKIQSSQQ